MIENRKGQNTKENRKWKRKIARRIATENSNIKWEWKKKENEIGNRIEQRTVQNCKKILKEKG